MSRLDPAIRLRRRQLDALALTLAAGQAAAAAIRQEQARLVASRLAERHHAALVPLVADAWFGAVGNRLAALSADQVTAERRLADLRRETVEARARLQLLEDAAAQQARAERRTAERRAAAALDDRIAARWSRR